MATEAGTMQLVLAILAALALVLGLTTIASPATGQTEGGAGIAFGTEEPAAQSEEDPPEPPIGLCLEVNPASGDVLYDLTGEGTYTGLPAAVYTTANGPNLDIKIVANDDTGRYWINPLGTWGQDECELDLLAQPAAIPVDINVNAEDELEGEDSDACDGSGTFTRVSDVFVAEWNLDENCNVQGNVPAFDALGEAPEDTLHTFEGELTPCLPEDLDPANSCEELHEAEAQLEGTYQQHLELP